MNLRWRLQRAFYTKKSRGKYGCAGIGCRDVFPGCHSCTQPKTHRGSDTEGAPNLADLKGIRPQYISNIVVNNWRLDQEGEDYGLLTMSPEKIGRLDFEPKITQPMNDVNGSMALVPLNDDVGATSDDSDADEPIPGLSPANVKLSEAMSASAAAVSIHMGSYEEAGDDYKNLFSLLGLEMGASVISDATAESTSCCWKVILTCYLHSCYDLFIVKQATTGDHARILGLSGGL